MKHTDVKPGTAGATADGLAPSTFENRLCRVLIQPERNPLSAGERERPSVSYLSISINYLFEEMGGCTNRSVVITEKPASANECLSDLPALLGATYGISRAQPWTPGGRPARRLLLLPWSFLCGAHARSWQLRHFVSPICSSERHLGLVVPLHDLYSDRLAVYSRSSSLKK